MIDRLSTFIKGIFGMTSFDLPADDPSLQRRVESVARSASGRTLKLPENTVQDCRDRTTADLLETVTVITAKRRRSLANGAESRTVRANLLGRLNRSFEKRDALDRAHKRYETDHVRL